MYTTKCIYKSIYLIYMALLYGVYTGEFFGTMMLILLGDGSVALTLLNKSKGYVLSGNGLASSWAVIIIGWFVGVTAGIAVAKATGSPYAAINPAVAISFVIAGIMPAYLLPGVIASEVAGAFLGAIIVYIAYYDHYKSTEDAIIKLSTFSTVPNIRNIPHNFVTEIIATFVLVVGVYGLLASSVSTLLSPALSIGLLVWGIGAALGGPTGYCINPARDLGPRIAHAILLKKDSSDWSYGLIVPIFAPIVGTLIASAAYLAFF